MAIYNQIQERGLNRVLQQRLTMLGDAPAPALVPELGANLVLEIDRPEWGRWKGEYPFSVATAVTAAAAEYSSVWMRPVAGLLIVVQQIAAFTTNALSFGWRTGQPSYTLAAVTDAYSNDNSSPGVAGFGTVSGTSVAFPGYDNVGAALFGRLNASISPLARVERPLILWPGGPGLLIRDSTANQAVSVVISGYFRRLLPNELG